MPPQLRLSELLAAIPGIRWDMRFGDCPVSMISCDSREDQPGALFVAIDGAKYKGDDFIQQAINQGARVVVRNSGSRIDPALLAPDVAVIEADDPKDFLRQVTGRFYGHPSSHVGTVGVTGTNGKTTITYLLESIIGQAGRRCGVIGTVNHRINGEVIPSKNTTPGFLDNQRYLYRLENLKTDYCVMEVSSHALSQGRVEGIDFACAIFTNLTQDHLDYHKDMESYFQAKALLFTGLTPAAAAVINTDCPYGQRLEGLSKGRVMTYGIDRAAAVRAADIRYGLDGTRFSFVSAYGNMHVQTALIGKHNVYNILAAASAALAMGLPLQSVGEGIASLQHVPGRLERVACGQDFYVFIDYAHTDDGLINVLQALRAVSDRRIIVLFGCGGDRDRGKRPKMGRAAGELADVAVVTSDNPRSEEPGAIIGDITAGFSRANYEVCVDRREAIGRALSLAGPGDTVLLAGKGHEDYQILKDKTIPFNERQIVEGFLKHVQRR